MRRRGASARKRRCTRSVGRVPAGSARSDRDRSRGAVDHAVDAFFEIRRRPSSRYAVGKFPLRSSDPTASELTKPRSSQSESSQSDNHAQSRTSSQLPASCGRRVRPAKRAFIRSMKAIISTRGGRARGCQQVAKNALVKRSISFAFSDSAICFFSRLISCRASDDVPALGRYRYQRAPSTTAMSQDSPRAALRHGWPQRNQTRDRQVLQRASEEHGHETRPGKGST